MLRGKKNQHVFFLFKKNTLFLFNKKLIISYEKIKKINDLKFKIKLLSAKN